jgi:hypothetical protein
MDPVALSWLPYLPASDRRSAERVEKEVVAAARRLGLATGPFEPPKSAEDELATRRRGPVNEARPKRCSVVRVSRARLLLAIPQHQAATQPRAIA